MSSMYFESTVTEVHHWTDRLFSFSGTREPGFRFQSGQFAMIGLPVDDKPLMRAYSMAGAHHDEQLTFLSIKVPEGPLTSRLSRIKPGDKVLVGRKATGTLLMQNLLPGRTLYLLATGTGLAPFMSIIQDPEVYERYDKVVLVHGCRQVAELAYRHYIESDLPAHEWLGEQVRRQLVYYPTVTREPFIHQGRIPDLMASGRLFSDIGLPAMNAGADRFMLCGSPEMLRDTKALLDAHGLLEGNMSTPGHYVIERAFVDK
jgi:ferredoxin--NADP+ reductase